MTPASRMSHYQQFQEVLKAEGLCAAMRLLNQKVPYRYSAVYRFERGMLRNICLVDKHDPSITSCPDVAVEDSYCVYVKRTAKPFGVSHALQDKRVEDHPKRRQFQCYYGVPLVSEDQELIGTVSHFDPDPHPLEEQTVSVLDRVAPLITAALITDPSLGATKPA